FWIANHEQPGENHDGEDDVHGRTRKCDNQPLPARLAQESARIVGILIAGLAPRHFHVAAEEDRRKAEIRLTSFESEQPRTEAKTKGLHLHVKKAGSPI